jgi:Gpi18-like mannosyltransferase
LTGALLGEQASKDSSLPVNAAALHIISPAGAFLSAPNSEGLFSFLSISGFLSFVLALQHFDKGQISAGSTNMLTAGIRFCVATVVRSNGILAGIPFLIEAIATAFGVLSQGLSRLHFTRLAPVVVGGMLVGFGLVYPQILAYQEYCHGRSPDNRRPWCNQLPPSIFTFVQSHYW